MHDPNTAISCELERGVLRGLEGGCQVPVAVYACRATESGNWRVRARVLSLDGGECIEADEVVSAEGLTEERAREAGAAIASRLVEKGAADLLRRVMEANKSP